MRVAGVDETAVGVVVVALYHVMVLVEDGSHVALIVLDLDEIEAVLHEAVAHEDALNGTVAVGVIAAIVAGHYHSLNAHRLWVNGDATTIAVELGY